MKAIFAATQLGHAPRHFLSKGRIVDYPEAPERARQLLAGARTAGAQIYGTRSFGPEYLTAIHKPGYLKFLETAWKEWAEIPDHGPELIASIKPLIKPITLSKNILARAGFHTYDMSAPITEQTWPSALYSACSALTAASLVIKGERAVYALCRPPGHHAYAARTGGFCYLNNCAIAAQHLRSKFNKIAILDIDLHHGNGTQGIFYGRNDVLTISIHADPAEFYPFYYGYAEETGYDEGQGFNLNIPLPLKSGDGAWLEALDKALEKIGQFAPGALVVALGLDAHEADPLQGGTVTTGGFARMAEKIAALGLPSLLVQEGGYLTAHLADNLAMFLTAFEGEHAQSVDVAAE